MAKLFAEFDRIEENMQQLVTAVGECLEKSLESVCKYLEEGETEEVKRLTETVHGIESEADDYRRKIIQNTLKGKLMPHTRSDMLQLVESIDDSADSAQDILDRIIFLGLKFDHLDQKQVKEMQELLLKQFSQLTQGVELLFGEMDQALVYARELEEIETRLDSIEEEITRKIGRIAELDTADKLAHRDLVKNISDLADIIENVGDSIDMIVSMRKG